MDQSKCLCFMQVSLAIIIFFTSLASSKLNDISKKALDERDVLIQDGSSYLNGATLKDVEM